MTTRRNFLAGCAVLSCAALAPSLAEADAGGAEALAIVSSKQGGVSELSLYQLKHLFLGETVQGPGGRALIALNRDAKSAERTGFDASVLGMTPEVAARYWIDRRIRGQSGAPKSVEPATVIQRVVARLPHAIAYVRVRDLTAEVQVVKIDGRKPGDPGYPIQAARTQSVAGFRLGTLLRF
jgi:hypothetical protein